VKFLILELLTPRLHRFTGSFACCCLAGSVAATSLLIRFRFAGIPSQSKIPKLPTAAKQSNKARYVVVLKPGVGAPRASSAASEAVRSKASVYHTLQNGIKGFAVELPTGATASEQQQLIQQLKMRPDVDYVFRDHPVRALGTSGTFCRWLLHLVALYLRLMATWVLHPGALPHHMLLLLLLMLMLMPRCGSCSCQWCNVCCTLMLCHEVQTLLDLKVPPPCCNSHAPTSSSTLAAPTGI
jgi:hypothetical protein